MTRVSVSAVLTGFVGLIAGFALALQEGCPDF
jgi:hypothetical protein